MDHAGILVNEPVAAATCPLLSHPTTAKRISVRTGLTSQGPPDGPILRRGTRNIYQSLERGRSPGFRALNLKIASWQRRAEARSELAEVKPIDNAVAVEVEVAQIVRIAGLRSEGAPEEAEVESVDGLVAVDVAEEAEDALGVAEDTLPRPESQRTG